ncbi:hypothetical protein [Slackia heliotrinireducens]|uniref:hypothetical protein n=1 Tax=Slackia heliotrinireducens TaxID=84110 RepID=UPI0033147CC4
MDSLTAPFDVQYALVFAMPWMPPIRRLVQTGWQSLCMPSSGRRIRGDSISQTFEKCKKVRQNPLKNGKNGALNPFKNEHNATLNPFKIVKTAG